MIGNILNLFYPFSTDCTQILSSRPRRPQGSTRYSPPGPLILRSEVSGNFKEVRWLRNCSDGENRILNNFDLEDLFPFPNSPKVAILNDTIASDKLPCTYQCSLIGECCDERRSEAVTITDRKYFL